MNMQKFIMATLAGTVTSFIAAYLVYALALNNYMSANSMEGLMNASPDFIWVILGHVVYSALAAYVFMKWANISTAVGGMKGGAILGLGFTLGTSLLYLGVSNMYTGGLAPAIVDALGGVIVWAIGGLGVGAALGMGKNKE